jgi:hypothetical protein
MFTQQQAYGDGNETSYHRLVVPELIPLKPHAIGQVLMNY